MNNVFSHIHTTVERLWRSMKEHIKIHKPKRTYEHCIGRYFFHQMLFKEEQRIYLINKLQKNNEE